MPLFESVSKIFAQLSPHRRHHHQQPDDRQQTLRQSSSQDDLSLTHSRESSLCSSQRERTAGSRNNQSYIPSKYQDKDKDGPLVKSLFSSQRDTAALSQDTQSYEKAFGYPFGSTHTRRQLRSPTSDSVIDCGERSGDSSQMLRKNQTRNESQEESRLLPGARFQHDKNAVKIRPGETKRKSTPGNSAAFKPTNSLSRNSRESGPVRAQGRSKMAPGLRINRPHPDEFFGPHAAGRPNKRQCNNDHLRSHDLTANRPAQRSPSRRPSLESSQSSRTVERGFLPKQHEEFRGVEDSVQIPKSFQRSKGNRSIPRKQGLIGGFLDEEDLRPVLPPPKNRSAIDLEANSSRDDAMSPNSSKVTPNSSSSRESPDVLQGGVTTKQSPRHIHSQQNHVSHNTNSDFLPSPSRKRSPTDIRPTDFASSPLQGPKRAKRSHGSSKSFDVKCINIGGKDHPGGKLVYRLEPKRLEFFGNTRTSEYDYLKILVRTIATVVLGDEQSSKAILKSSRDINSSVLNVGIEFTKILEKDKFATLIRKDDAKIINRSMAYMDNVFNRFGTGTNAPSKTSKKPLIESVSSEPSQEAAVSSTRQKLSSALQGDPDDSKKEGKTPKKRDTATTSGGGDKGSKAEWSASDDKDDQREIEIPVKKFQPKAESERQTRSVGRRSTRLSDISIKQQDEDMIEASSKLPLKDDPFREEWEQPLVYPSDGKKKAEVTLKDRDRLRDAEEFLNDNLIAFYMRFLEDHLERTNKEAEKQVYFFNSYFYDTLTKVSRGQRGINYSGVAKWTRNVDLFSYNYVVVPINQNAHWYVAIICNLPGLFGENEPNEARDDEKADPTASNAKESSTQPGSEVHEILESPEPEANTEKNRATRSPESQPSEATRGRLASMSLEFDLEEASARLVGKHKKGKQQEENQLDKTSITKDPQEPTSADEWPTEDDHRPSPIKFTAGSLDKKKTEAKKKTTAAPQASASKKGKAGQKLSPIQTTIITFDSLDLARSPTIRMLREYICEESVSKRGKEVDPKDIKGMRARQIPLQPNYSDCGLYLLAYLEKFAQDPRQFVTKLLQREMDEKEDWPPLGSGLLRQRLRNFLDQLYQEQRVRGSKAENQQLLVDREPISYLLGPSSIKAKTEEQVGDAPEEPKQLPDPDKKANPDTETTKKTTATSNPESYKSEPESDSDDSSEEDQLQLVPTGRPPATKSREQHPSSSTENPFEIHPPKKKDEDVVEVPDSQPSNSLESINTKPKKCDIEKGVSKAKITDHKQSKVDDHDPGKSKPNKPAKVERPRVEIQIRATPPTSPTQARKSPRNTKQKD